jgi:hypothetical protein
VAVHDVGGPLGQRVLRADGHQRPTAADALGVVLGLVLGDAPVDQGADQPARGRADAGAGQRGDDRPHGEERAEPGDGQRRQAGGQSRGPADERAGRRAGDRAAVVTGVDLGRRPRGRTAGGGRVLPRDADLVPGDPELSQLADDCFCFVHIVE